MDDQPEERQWYSVRSGGLFWHVTTGGKDVEDPFANREEALAEAQRLNNGGEPETEPEDAPYMMGRKLEDLAPEMSSDMPEGSYAARKDAQYSAKKAPGNLEKAADKLFRFVQDRMHGPEPMDGQTNKDAGREAGKLKQKKPSRDGASGGKIAAILAARVCAGVARWFVIGPLAVVSMRYGIDVISATTRGTGDAFGWGVIFFWIPSLLVVCGSLWRAGIDFQYTRSHSKILSATLFATVWSWVITVMGMFLWPFLLFSLFLTLLSAGTAYVVLCERG